MVSLSSATTEPTSSTFRSQERCGKQQGYAPLAVLVSWGLCVHPAIRSAYSIASAGGAPVTVPFREDQPECTRSALRAPTSEGADTGPPNQGLHSFTPAHLCVVLRGLDPAACQAWL